jgi:hypothetical protein
LIEAPAGKGLILFDYLTAIEEQERLYGSNFEKVVLTVPRVRSQRKAATGRSE